jgi:hypothetical protein
MQLIRSVTIKFPIWHYYRSSGARSWYSDSLRAGKASDQSSSPGKVTTFHCSISSRPALGANAAPYPMDSEVLSGGGGGGVKRLGHETDLSLPTSAKVKTTWIYISTPPYVFMA